MCLNVAGLGGAALLGAGLLTVHPVPYARPDRSGIVEGNSQLEAALQSSTRRETLSDRTYRFSSVYRKPDGSWEQVNGVVSAISPKMALANATRMAWAVQRERAFAELYISQVLRRLLEQNAMHSTARGTYSL